ncbi:MAG TPA: hypothetical protein VH092_20260 [Urbifossiella sp.]|jgi:integrase|nr:hypothetical protein [Urbifossiella sp.]
MPQKPTFLTVGAETKTLGEWVALHGVPASTIRSRIALGWSLEQAVSVPPDRRFKPRVLKSTDGPRPCPRLRRHKGSGQAFCEWVTKGERHVRYFGVAGSPEATEAYTRFTVEWATRAAHPAPALPPGETAFVCEVVEGWLDYCLRGHDGQGGYKKHGKPTSELHLQRSAAKYLFRLYGETAAAEFGPDQLRTVRAAMIEAKLARPTVNAYQPRIVQMFGWAVGKKLVPGDTWLSLKQIERLERGKTTAPDKPRRRSVPWDRVEAVFPHLHKNPAKRQVLEAMVRAHWFIGCRPQDITGLTPADLDREASPWLWTVEKHKNEDREQPLTYWIGPKAQAVLEPLLAGCPADRRVFGAGEWTPVTRLEYGRFVKRACKLAEIDPWTPHQICKARATEVMRRYESEEAAAAIGDTPEVAAKVYIDPMDAVRRRIAKELG